MSASSCPRQGWLFVVVSSARIQIAFNGQLIWVFHSNKLSFSISFKTIDCFFFMTVGRSVVIKFNIRGYYDLTTLDGHRLLTTSHLSSHYTNRWTGNNHYTIISFSGQVHLNEWRKAPEVPHQPPLVSSNKKLSPLVSWLRALRNVFTMNPPTYQYSIGSWTVIDDLRDFLSVPGLLRRRSRVHSSPSITINDHGSHQQEEEAFDSNPP